MNEEPIEDMRERKHYTEPITPGVPPEEKRDGIVCPVCHCRHFRVLYTRKVRRGIKRRRECRHCGKRLSTIEKPKEPGDAK